MNYPTKLPYLNWLLINWVMFCFPTVKLQPPSEFIEGPFLTLAEIGSLNFRERQNTSTSTNLRDCPATGWVAKRCLCVFWGSFLMGGFPGKKNININPQKIPGQSHEKFVYP